MQGQPFKPEFPSSELSVIDNVISACKPLPLYNMSGARKKLVVCGGTGFLGSRICRAAAARNWTVTSLSRSGEPTWSAVTSSPSPPPWAGQVSWQKANVLQPDSYSEHLQDADAVVHSMGILLEADYKGVLQGRESPLSGLARAFQAVKGGSSQNPLERKPGEGLDPGEKDGQLTYELMNRDSGKRKQVHMMPFADRGMQ